MTYTINEIAFRMAPGPGQLVNLLIEGDGSGAAIEFNGYRFVLRPKSEVLREDYRPLARYARADLRAALHLERIAQDGSSYFLQLSNGDIFQLGPVMDPEGTPQRLEIYRSFLPGYRQALDRINESTPWHFNEG